MGQQQVKIPTSNHLVTLALNKRQNLDITVHACNSDRQLSLQNHHEYIFSELPQNVQQEFHTMKELFKNFNELQGNCCTGSNGHYKLEFENGNLILRKKDGKNMSIKVNKIEMDSSEMTIELDDKVVSLEDRLERQVSNNKKMTRNSALINLVDAAKNQTVPLQKHFFKLQNGFYLSLFNLNANIVNSIKHSALDPSIITHLDLSGNGLTTSDLNDILGLNWSSLKKLWLDDNLLESTKGIERLKNIAELSLTKNLLNLEAAQYLSKANFDELRFLKISCLVQVGKDIEKCWQTLWRNDGRNFPKLERLVIVHNKLLPERIKRNFQDWKSGKTVQGKERQVIYEVKDLEKISNEKISNLNKINTLGDYPEMG